MDVAGDIFCCEFSRTRQRQLRQKFNDIMADHVGAEDLAIFFVANHFDKAAGSADPPSFCIRLEGKLGDLDVITPFFCLFFGITKAGDLRLAIGRARHHVTVQRDCRRAGDVFGGCSVLDAAKPRNQPGAMRTDGLDADGAPVEVNFLARSEALRGIGERLDFDLAAYPPRARDSSDGDVSVRRLRAPARAAALGRRRSGLRRGVLARARARPSSARSTGSRRHAAAQTISKVARIPRLTAATRISARIACATLP